LPLSPLATTAAGERTERAAAPATTLREVAGRQRFLIRQQTAEGGNRQIKPREPRRPQPDATTLRGGAKLFRGHPLGVMGKREPQTIETIDDRSIHVEIWRDGKFTAKSAGCGETRVFLEGDKSRSR
jgi:hypothetical protein